MVILKIQRHSQVRWLCLKGNKAMTNEERIKSWMEHWEQVRDLAAANGDYLRWEAAEREIKNYETILKRWSAKGQ